MLHIKAVVVGDGAVGKTSLLMKCLTGEFSHYHIPVVWEQESIIVKDATIRGHREPQNVIIDFWDTAGQEDYDRLRPLCYPNTDVFLMCFSFDSRQSFDNLRYRWYMEVSHHVPTADRILIGLKSDLRRPVHDEVTLVFGYVHQLEFFKEMDIADDIIDIIYDLLHIEHYHNCDWATDTQIEEWQKACGCAHYVELSALEMDNFDNLFDVIITTVYGKKRKSTKCVLL